MAKIKILNVLWMPEGPLLISTVWYRAGLPNKLTPLASIELSWQQKREAHLTARPCWMPELFVTDSSSLPAAVCEMCDHFGLGWSFWLRGICSLQSVWNATHKLICFAGLRPHSALFFFRVPPLVALQSFTRVKPLWGLSEPFSPFPLSTFLVFFLFIARKRTLQTKHPVQLNVKGSEHGFLPCFSFPVRIMNHARSQSL